MARITIDGNVHQVDGDRNLLEVCLDLKIDLPYFCWHPAMGSVGACRQCAVKHYKDEQDDRGRIVMACMTPAKEGTRISVTDAEAREFRASVIEWLMQNHPHDCPVCDEGGECHLQDMTVMSGHVYRDYRFKKRTYRNQYLGPFVTHEMNRCIQCYRCVRFYRDYAGGRDFDVFGSQDRVYFGRYEDGTLESPFSGNLVEVCPTGVFTDKTLRRHYTRKWDLRSAPSVCVHCGAGCNTLPAERYGTLRRIENRFHREVNGHFLCDRGRFGYEFVSAATRLREPQRRRGPGAPLEPVSAEEALAEARRWLAPADRVIGIGSPRASLESNFALRRLVGPGRFYLGCSPKEAQALGRILAILQTGPVRSASLFDLECSDAVFVLGEDVTNSAPRMALSIRQSIRQAPRSIAQTLGIALWDDHAVRSAAQGRTGPLLIATPGATALDDAATRTFRGAPDDLARLGFEVARLLGAPVPPIPELSQDARSFAAEISGILGSAKRPAVVSGMSLGSVPAIEAAADIAWALGARNSSASLAYVVPEADTLGLGLLGGKPLEEAFEAIENGTAEVVVVLENDLFRRADPRRVDAFLSRAKGVIAIDHLENPTTSKASVVLPAATFAESTGTFVSGEGRAQRFFEVMPRTGSIRDGWRWAEDLQGPADGFATASRDGFDRLMDALARQCSALSGVLRAAPDAHFRKLGQKIPREAARSSGRTAIFANINVSEPKPPEDPDSPLSYTMEGYPGPVEPSLIPVFWAPGWNSNQAMHKFQHDVLGPLEGGPSGVRLIEPAAGPASYFSEIPPAFSPKDGAWLFIPSQEVFGSEELSALAPAIRQRMPEPYVDLHPEDAKALGAGEGETVEAEVETVIAALRLRVRSEWPRGVAGIPDGLSPLSSAGLPAWGTIRRKS